MKYSRGFTIIELMVVMVIVAILISLAAPSLTKLIQSNTISGNVNTFTADMRLARNEALRLGGAVVMCRSASPESATATCATSGADWVSGWIIFQDLDNSGDRATTEPIIRVQAPITSMDSIAESYSTASTKTASTNSTVFRFTATGRLLSLSKPVNLQFGGGNYTQDIQRVVCVNLSGRARIAGDGSQSCSTDQ